MALHVGHNCNPWDDCDVCGAKVEPPYQRADRERTKNMARLVGASETIDHREVNGWTVTLFHHLPHNGKQPPFSYSASVRENAGENVLSYYGETREAVELEVLHIVGVSPLNAAALVEENAALRAEVAALRAACTLALGIMEQKNRVTVLPTAKFVDVKFAPEDIAVLRAALEKK